jgi:hypothetical protein
MARELERVFLTDARDAPTDEELLFAAAYARSGLEEAVATLEQKVAHLREELGYDAGPLDAPDGHPEDDPDDDGSEEDDGPDDDPEDAGLDRKAMLERQLKDRTPEVGLALTEIAGLVRRAMPLGTELATLRARAAARGDAPVE